MVENNSQPAVDIAKTKREVCSWKRQFGRLISVLYIGVCCQLRACAAKFNIAQQQATADTIQDTGFEGIVFWKRPQRQPWPLGFIKRVYDFGGETFEVSLLHGQISRDLMAMTLWEVLIWCFNQRLFDLNSQTTNQTNFIEQVEINKSFSGKLSDGTFPQQPEHESIRASEIWRVIRAGTSWMMWVGSSRGIVVALEEMFRSASQCTAGLFFASQSVIIWWHHAKTWAQAVWSVIRRRLYTMWLLSCSSIWKQWGTVRAKMIPFSRSYCGGRCHEQLITSVLASCRISSLQLDSDKKHKLQVIDDRESGSWVIRLWRLASLA